MGNIALRSSQSFYSFELRVEIATIFEQPHVYNKFKANCFMNIYQVE